MSYLTIREDGMIFFFFFLFLRIFVVFYVIKSKGDIDTVFDVFLHPISKNALSLLTSYGGGYLLKIEFINNCVYLTFYS